MEEIGESLPLAEGMAEIENASKHSVGYKKCLNCDTELVDMFCSHCGQKNIPRRQKLGELIENFVGSFFSFESKFFRTIKYLLLKPGFLSKEYNSGKRESYYHPARMYVFTSFIYFLLFFSLPDNQSKIRDVQNENVISSDSTSNQFNFSLTTDEYKSRAEYDSVQAALPEADKDGWLMQKMQYRSLDLNEKYEGNKSQFSREFGDSFAANAPKIFFLLLPVFALLLKGLYIRRDFYYSEHLVLSIYFYKFFICYWHYYITCRANTRDGLAVKSDACRCFFLSIVGNKSCVRAKMG